MTTYGLRVLNDDSELLVDSNYFSPAFAQKLEFSPSAVSEIAGDSYRHSGYVKREYRTPPITVPGKYIVMWTLPTVSTDVWYGFQSSTANMGESLTCYVYANSLGDPLIYTLPTAYLFATTSLPSSSGYGLQLFNESGNKSYDSDNVQLVPYYVSESFSFWNDPTGLFQNFPSTIEVPALANRIFMLPDYNSLRISGAGSPTHSEFLHEPVFRTTGANGINLQVKELCTSYSNENSAWPYSQTVYNTGNRSGLAVIMANADLYQSPSPGAGTGTNPTYILTSNTNSTNEGTTVIVTLTTTRVSNGSVFPWVVGGIAAADLSAGSLSGNFIIQNNNATASFTFANDLLLEGTEVFTLGVTNTSLSVSVNILDTSTPTPVYTFLTVSSINENATGSTTFRATNANGKVVTFSVVAPISGNTVDGLDGTLNTTSWTVPSNAQSSVLVSYTAAGDYYTEGPETFRLAAAVDGTVVAYSNDITVNDLSTSSITCADTWQESSSNTVTINSLGPLNGTLYLTTSNSLVTPSVSSVLVDSAYGPLNPTGFTTTVTYTAGIVTSNTAVDLYIRTGSASGRIVAQKTITVTNVGETYSFGGVSAINEGASGSVSFNYNYAANRTITFAIAAPSSGTTANTPADVTLSTTSHSIGNTNSSGSVSINFSAVSDSTTEGAEAFRISATVNGFTYYSDNITINDSSVTPPAATITVADSWAESTTTSVSINATNANGITLYLTTSDSLVTPSLSTITPNSANYTIGVNYTTGIVTANTSVTIYVRTGSTVGTILASKTITVTNTASTYSWNSVSWPNEGTSPSTIFNFNSAANKTITFALAAPPSGFTSATLGTDVTLSTTSYTVPNSNAAGTVSVSYSVIADSLTEGGEYFRLAATVDGITYYSDPIFIYDTSIAVPTFSLTPVNTTWIAADPNGMPTSNYNVIMAATNYIGNNVFFTTNNAAINSWLSTNLIYVYSNNWSETYIVGVPVFSSSTAVQLQLRTGSNSGPIVATANVTVNPFVPPPTYSLSASPNSVNEGNSFTITLTTNQSGSFGYTISGVSSADIGGTSLTGTLSNGGTRTINVTADAITEGTEYFSVSLDNGLASTSVTISDTSQAPVYPAAGTTSGGQYCIGFTLYQNYHDGSGGVYASVLAYNSPSCGYSTPSYSLGDTWTSLGNNSTSTFYLQASGSFTNGTTVTVSKSGAGSNRVSINPTSFTLSTGTTYYYVQVTASLPTSTVAAESVTISVSTGQNFTFTVPAYTFVPTAPIVTSVTMSDVTYPPGLGVQGYINFSGPITANTYVNVRFVYAGMLTYLPNSSSTEGVSPPGAYGYFGEDLTLTIGQTSATFLLPAANTESDQFNNRVSAKTVTAPTGGSDRQPYVVGPAFTLLGSGGGGNQNQ
jgi:hypothetical protein